MERAGMEDVLGGCGGLHDVAFCQCRPVAEVGEQVPAEQGAGGLLEEDAGLPSMGHVRRIDVAYSLAPQVKDVTVGHGHRRAIGKIVQRDHAAQRPVRDLCGRGRGEEQVHRSALISLDVTERDPPQRVEREHPGDRFADAGEHCTGPGVKQQRLFGLNEELIEGEAGGADVGNEGREPEDALGDFVELGFHE
jgi:hypothetical protein